MQTKRVAIIGGGIAGLAAAHRLSMASQNDHVEVDIHLFERKTRLGGVIRTEQRDGFLLEWGPENFVGFKPALTRLIEEIGLKDQIIGSNDQIRRTYVVSDGSVVPLPDGMAFLAPVALKTFWANTLLSTRGKLRTCLEPFVSRSQGEISVEDFLTRRMGREMTQKIAEPLISAIYGGDIRDLSMQSALGDTLQTERRYGSLYRGMRKRRPSGKGPGKSSFFLSMHDGMESLVEGLQRNLANRIQFHLGTPALRVNHRGGWVVGRGSFADRFDAVILACPASAAGEILEDLEPAATGLLRQIPYGSVSLVYLAYPKADFDEPPEGFGLVTQRADSTVMDACTFVSSKFDHRCSDDRVLFRCALHNGRRDRPAESHSSMIGRVHEQLEEWLRFRSSPIFEDARTLPHSMVHPTLHHQRRLNGLKAVAHRHPGLYLAGAYCGGVGLPDSAESGQLAADRALDYLFHPETVTEVLDTMETAVSA